MQFKSYKKPFIFLNLGTHTQTYFLPIDSLIGGAFQPCAIFGRYANPLYRGYGMIVGDWET